MTLACIGDTLICKGSPVDLFGYYVSMKWVVLCFWVLGDVGIKCSCKCQHYKGFFLPSIF